MQKTQMIYQFIAPGGLGFADDNLMLATAVKNASLELTLHEQTWQMLKEDYCY